MFTYYFLEKSYYYIQKIIIGYFFIIMENLMLFFMKWTAEISNPFYGEPYGLLQLWFKEFQGKVFTFRLFFSLDHYVLNVSLIEGSHVSQVQTWMIAPSYQVTVEEGKDLFY